MTQVSTIDHVVIRFSGDSGDGMQLTGDRFTQDTAVAGNDFVTLPNYPAEIRAPAGTVAGVSSFQLHFAEYDVHTPGDHPDVLVAMNPAALKANIAELPAGGIIIVDTADFTPRALSKVGYDTNPLEDGSLEAYQVHAFDLTAAATAAVAPFGLSRKDAARTKNMYALGLLNWMYSRPIEGTIAFLNKKFAKKPEIRDANIASLTAGYNFGETSEAIAFRYEIAPAPAKTGTYRQITGNRAVAYGLVAGANRAGLPLYLGAYPITPASEVLHYLSDAKSAGVMTFQAEDEIAAVGAALGASFAGCLGATSTSGPGLALKSETLGLAVISELPLVVIDVQRGGPSTGLPTKTEQSDLHIALFGRHGESPMPVIAAQSPADCFAATFEACKVAVEYRTPVLVLTDGYLGNGAEPWRVPEMSELPAIDTNLTTEVEGEYLPYARDEKLARAWAIPGTPGLTHRTGGLEKAPGSGAVSYDPSDHEEMVLTRAAKVAGVVRDVPDLIVDDPSGEAKVLVLGWGSTFGPIQAAVRIVRGSGRKLATAHLRWINPLPANLGEVLAAYDRVIVPEMNLGQLAMLLRATYLINVESYTKVRGLPLRQSELADDLNAIIDEEAAK
ncbi:MAG TPA: 2-oxoacid:acceptor oxidoreductase subunit alpha [Propionicimonas sp.]|nr:2-oxoacid:acceptor oxidoreductase subunit alpha [Propionicimonas sp.]